MQELGQAQRRILKVVLALAGHELLGLAPVEIQRALSITNASTLTRDLDVLRDMGIAEQIPETGRWRLGPRLVQIAVAFANQMDRAEKRLGEIRQRYSREP